MRSLTDFAVPTSDARRKAQARLTRLMPADAAAAAVLLLGTGRPNDKPLPLDVTDHESGMPALRRERALVPLIEPNILAWGRMITSKGAAPSPSTSHDGVLTAQWDSPARHHAAAATVVDEYLNRHDLVDFLRTRLAHSSLDSWHEPLAIAPVRHTYADGSPSVLRWQAVDGTARIVAARLAFAEAFGPWLGDHPWASARNDWPTDAVTLRRFLAAARIEADRLADARRTEDPDMDVQASWYLTTPAVEDFADLILPSTDKSEFGDLAGTLAHWNFMSHTTGTRPDPSQFPQPVIDYLTHLDIWAGQDPYTVRGLNPADAHEREDVTESEDLVREWLFIAGGPDSVKAARLAGFAVAVSSPVTAPDTDPVALFRAYATTLLGRDGAGLAIAGDATAALGALTDALGAPDLGDLFGVHMDLTADYVNDPLREPDSPWFWLGAAQGVMYAAVLDHFAGLDVAATVTALLASPAGRDQVLAYADALQEGKARVLRTDGTGGFATGVTLETLAAARQG